MSLELSDLKELLQGARVCYEHRRTLSSLEVNVDLAEVPPELLKKLIEALP